MKYLSVCTGAGGMDLGLEAAGHEMIGMVEMDPNCRDVLTYHWPHVRLWENARRLACAPDGTELVAGGTPCQDLSVAGRGVGLGGTRSDLFWDFCRISAEVPWVLWENVAGVLSRRFAADFAAVLWGITGFHPQVPKNGWASGGLCAGPRRTAVWRVLDARYFGVPQRRRRVFIVGGPPGQCGPEILALAQGGAGHPRPSTASREDLAGSLGAFPRNDLDGHEAYVSALTGNMVGARTGADDNAAQAGHLIPLTLAENERGELRLSELAMNLGAGGGKPGTGYPAMFVGNAVRRLTPVECERLMGWPDQHTKWRPDGTVVPDVHRYKMCGNGVVAPVAKWIGERLVDY